jgi:hypothetical protein
MRFHRFREQRTDVNLVFLTRVHKHCTAKGSTPAAATAHPVTGERPRTPTNAREHSAGSGADQPFERPP